ncbi:Ppx/GppA phosphatase family protein [Shewanella sp. OMA3-2]|uniref:Ppx/GppA phosphatase family protein n=1 Tax=Shewanella sp. OMA3-2 TaxID=2908650 RepID=UPI001F38C5BF|nr:exopolyphosphatase [Shewanella sp. OMA3-2]UJF21922.1 exopolyphosphatase [Shewanella sp. OMA3-2]
MPRLSTLPAYAAITLGSNSFNMLVAVTVAGQPQIIAKYKRKVRLAEGIGDDGYLSNEVMQRGLDCLTLFADMLKKHRVNQDDVAVIATATLRVIANADDFKQQALPILGQPIEIISGLREAELIYQGMVATTAGIEKRLVIDIGGASTEFIVGKGSKVLFKTSLDFGCVRFNQQIFNQVPYQLHHFQQAKMAVSNALLPHVKLLKELGWQSVVGASGAVQSVVSVLNHRELPEIITLKVLYRFRDEVLAQKNQSLNYIQGLSAEKAPTFTSGVAILIALFELLDIDSLNLSGGALREGVLKMLADRVVDER